MGEHHLRPGMKHKKPPCSDDREVVESSGAQDRRCFLALVRDFQNSSSIRLWSFDGLDDEVGRHTVIRCRSKRVERRGIDCQARRDLVQLRLCKC
jgi:hypothetical protein